MARLEDIRGLAEAHASSISSSPRDWMNYLDTAARLYRYPFMDQLLIHAQRPQATACASLELWNQKMFRWVNRGAKGIALIDETTQKTRLRYVFDVQDTHMVNGGRTPYLWKLQEEQQEEGGQPAHHAEQETARPVRLLVPGGVALHQMGGPQPLPRAQIRHVASVAVAASRW